MGWRVESKQTKQASNDIEVALGSWVHLDLTRPNGFSQFPFTYNLNLLYKQA